MKVDAFTLRGTARVLYERAGGKDFWAEPDEAREAWLQQAADALREWDERYLGPATASMLARKEGR